MSFESYENPAHADFPGGDATFVSDDFVTADGISIEEGEAGDTEVFGEATTQGAEKGAGGKSGAPAGLILLVLLLLLILLIIIITLAIVLPLTLSNLGGGGGGAVATNTPTPKYTYTETVTRTRRRTSTPSPTLTKSNTFTPSNTPLIRGYSNAKKISGTTGRSNFPLKCAEFFTSFGFGVELRDFDSDGDPELYAGTLGVTTASTAGGTSAQGQRNNFNGAYSLQISSSFDLEGPSTVNLEYAANGVCASGDVNFDAAATDLGCGHAISVFDINRDGILDIACGMPSRIGRAASGTTAAETHAGGYYVAMLDSNGLIKGTTASPGAAPGVQQRTMFVGATGAALVGNLPADFPITTDDNFGYSICISDMNNDGVPDAIIGAPGTDCESGANDCGAIYIVYHKADPISAGSVDYIVAVDGYKKLTAGINGIPSTMLVASDWFGTDVDVDLVDNDNILDIAVGAPGDDALGKTTPQAGAVYILFMKIDGTVKSYTKLTTGTGGLPAAFPLDQWDEFGFGVALGDINGDAIPDLVVGAPSKSSQAAKSHGSAYIIALQRSGTAIVNGWRRISQGLGNQFSTDASLDSLMTVRSGFGTSVDLWRAGPDQQHSVLAVGAPFDRTTTSAAGGIGAVYVMNIN